MILGTKKTFERYLLTGFLLLVFLLPAWLGRAGDLGLEHALRRSLGTSALVFLCVTLLIGPLGVLWKPALRLLTWRRETGVWFFLLALAHALMAAGGAFNWNLLPTITRGVGQANLLGLAALFLSLLLAATSTDRAVNFLGISSWKWLHYSAYAIFYLTFGHLYYFVFVSSQSAVNRFGAPYLFLVAIVPLTQAAAFIRVVISQRVNLEARSRAKRPVTVRLRGRREIAPGTWSVDFDARGTGFRFQAGQYTGVRLPQLAYPDPRGPFRVFSIVSTPGNRRTITISFRNSGSGFKKTLLEMPVGSPVEITPASGYLLLPPSSPKKNLVFVAGGIGVTPFVSMLAHAAARKIPHRMTLLWVNRKEDSAPFLEEIRKISADHRNIRLHACFSPDKFLSAVREVKEPGKKTWYLAGSHSMVTEIKNILLERQVPPAQIRAEEFFGL